MALAWVPMFVAKLVNVTPPRAIERYFVPLSVRFFVWSQYDQNLSNSVGNYASCQNLFYGFQAGWFRKTSCCRCSRDHLVPKFVHTEDIFEVRRLMIIHCSDRLQTTMIERSPFPTQWIVFNCNSIVVQHFNDESLLLHWNVHLWIIGLWRITRIVYR